MVFVPRATTNSANPLASSHTSIGMAGKVTPDAVGKLPPQVQHTTFITPTTVLVDDPVALVDDPNTLVGSQVTPSPDFKVSAIVTSAKGHI